MFLGIQTILPKQSPNFTHLHSPKAQGKNLVIMSDSSHAYIQSVSTAYQLCPRHISRVRTLTTVVLVQATFISCLDFLCSLQRPQPLHSVHVLSSSQSVPFIFTYLFFYAVKLAYNITHISGVHYNLIFVYTT